MPKVIYVISLFFLCFCNSGSSQITGTVVDQSGAPLSFVTVYVEGTTQGSVANMNGQYQINLNNKGDYNIVFQYIGYQTLIKKVHYDGKLIVMDVVMSEENYALDEVTIAANREDPAYPVIRQAIAKRDFHRHQVTSLEADLYVKGKVKMLNAPTKIMGQDIGNLGGILDTSRQGILYLSESTSKYYYQDPNKTKEVMISSVKAGENDLFTANRFQMFQFDIYDEYYRFARSIASPLSDNALSHYKYTLESTFYTDEKDKIYKIKISPKSDNEPLFSGYIYIADNYFNVYSLDASISGPTLRGTILDSVHFQQIYIPVKNKDNRRLLSQVVSFKGGVMGFKVGGTFTYVFSNYVLNPDLSSIFKNNENFSIQKNALNRDSLFWSNTRPVPLTDDEKDDYIKKDSLVKIWRSKPFLDSIDRQNNKFTFLKLLTGYSYQNSHKNFELATPKFQEIYSFNPIEGSRLKMGLTYSTSDSLNKSTQVSFAVNYGFTDHSWKPMLNFNRIYDNYHSAEIYGQVGRKYWQFDYKQPINPLGQLANNLFFKLNHIRMYDLRIVEIGWKKELINGVYVDFSTSFQDRRPLSNNTNYSIRYKAKIYESNVPNVQILSDYFTKNQYFVNQLRFTIRPFQKYSSYPNLKLTQASKWPVIELFVDNFIGVSSNTNHFFNITSTIRDNFVGMKLLGYTRYRISAGTFLGGSPSFFGDFYHPAANELLFPLIKDQLVFNLMPFYEYSTNKYFFEAHWRHHLNGCLFDYLPLIKKTSLKEVFGVASHYDPTNGYYTEMMAGVEDIKIGGLKLFDIEYTWSFKAKKYFDQGIVIRFTQALNGRF